MRNTALLLTLGLWLLLLAPSWAQSPSPLASASPSASPTPAGATADVVFHGHTLFSLAGSGGLTPAQRATQLETRLQEAADRAPAGQAPQVLADVVRDSLTLTAQGVVLITVSTADATAAHMSPAELGAHWQDALQDTLNAVAHQRTTLDTRTALEQCCIALLIGLLLHLLVRHAVERWLRLPGWTFNMVVWLIVVTFCLRRFAATRDLGGQIGSWVVRPLFILMVVGLVAVGIVALAQQAVTRYFRALEMVRVTDEEKDFHERHRLQMVRSAVLAFSRVIVIGTAVVVYLSALHVNVAALATGAGLLGVAIGVASQDFIKDVSAGVNIILEDQFSVGDIIASGDQRGRVEAFNLRATTIRDEAGNLVVMPNGTVRILKNLSTASWRLLNLSFTVADQDDLEEALDRLNEAARSLQKDGTDRILETPVLQVVTDTQAHIAVQLKVRPGTEASVSAAMRRRGDMALARRSEPQPAT